MCVYFLRIVTLTFGRFKLMERRGNQPWWYYVSVVERPAFSGLRWRTSLPVRYGHWGREGCKISNSSATKNLTPLIIFGVYNLPVCSNMIKNSKHTHK